jgi:hypothetical protein
MEIYAVHDDAAAIFLLQPIHDGLHFPAIHSGPGEELDEDQVFLPWNVGEGGRFAVCWSNREN